MTNQSLFKNMLVKQRSSGALLNNNVNILNTPNFKKVEVSFFLNHNNREIARRKHFPSFPYVIFTPMESFVV